MEAAVRWSPYSDGQHERFLLADVIDQSLTLHQVRHRDRKQIQHVAVARYGRLPNFSAFWYSQNDPYIVALGLVSGSACLVQLREGDRSSETLTTFKLKQQRKCNSIALSRENWLAVALDKTRSDVCLNVYDANGGSRSHHEPVRKLCPAEVVSSVRFFANQPREMIVAAQRSFVRLYDLRDGHSGNSSSLQIVTRCVNNIAIDPLDENYFAAAGSTDDPAVTVWDKRWISQSSAIASDAVFEFRPAIDNTTTTSTIWSLRYSGNRRGRLAISSNRGELKVVDMVMGESSVPNNIYAGFGATNPYGGETWASNRYVSQIRGVERPYNDTHDGALTSPTPKLMAFDWIPCASSASEQSILALRPNREVDIVNVAYATQHAAVTGRDDLSLAYGSIQIAETCIRSDTISHDARNEQQRSAEDFGPREYSGEANGYEDDVQVLCYSADDVRLQSLLAPAGLQRERCRQGYLFDPATNMDIVRGNWQLERLWEIVSRFQQQATNDGMMTEHFDLSFVGVAGICLEQVDNLARRTASPRLHRIEDAVTALNSSRELPAFEGERTEFPEHRQLCLELCGWKFTSDGLEAECQELIENGQHYQAIVQAVLHGDKHIALNMLRSLVRSKTVPNIGLGALLASDSINEQQREMCLWMAADTEDAALKALLTYLTTGNWRDVMKTSYLHLGYRVALGLKYLNDTDLNGFIEGETARAIKNGDLEGVLLTGLGGQGMELLQTYISKTNDVQTAVLASAATNPLYVDDARWEMWKETYFQQMQSWRAFTERARFVVAHNRMARGPDGRSMLPAPHASVVLQCSHCQRGLAVHNTDNTETSTNTTNNTNKKNGSTTAQTAAAQSAGIVCPQCGRHMPRCGICRMWLGTPDPAIRGGADELQRASELMARMVTFCVQCQHAHHAHHARIWFRKHMTCPVPDCRCRCTSM